MWVARALEGPGSERNEVKRTIREAPQGAPARPGPRRCTRPTQPSRNTPSQAQRPPGRAKRRPTTSSPSGVSRGWVGGVGREGVGGTRIGAQRSEANDPGGPTGRASAPGPATRPTQPSRNPPSQAQRPPGRAKRRPTTSSPSGVSRGWVGGVGREGVGGTRIGAQRSEANDPGGPTGRASAPGPAATHTPEPAVAQPTKPSAASPVATPRRCC